MPEMLAISFWYLVNLTEFLCRISVILVSSIKVVKKVDLSNTKTYEKAMSRSALEIVIYAMALLCHYILTSCDV